MALQRITPTPAHVSWNRRLALPAAVRFADRRLTVTSVDTVRDETAAYPVGRGPRITYLVDTDAGQASLVFDPRARRWFIDALEPAA
jgi:hypothetical protein